VRVAFITLGQSPREDIMSDIGKYLKGIEYVEYGLLDDLTLEEIEREFKPLPNELAYVSRLRDGSEVKLSKNKVTSRLQELVSKVEGSVDLIVILCTGDFNIRSSKPVVYPSQALISKVTEISPRTLGVVVPLESQVDMARKRWCRVSEVTGIIVWSPYSGTEEELTRSAEVIKGSEVVVMDCLGYSIAHKKLLETATNSRVIVPREVVAELITEFSRRL